MHPWCEINLDEFLKRLENYVNMDTPSGNKELLDKMSDSLRKDLFTAGCDVTVHEREGGNVLEARIGNGQKQLLLLGHMDTVFPEGTAEKRPFKREGDILTGPGVLDMKSGVLMITEIMRHFAGNLPDDWSVCAVLNCDEEIGSRQSRDLILEKARTSKACLCMEPMAPGWCTVARKGLYSFRVHVKGVAAHSGVNYQAGRSAIQELCRIVTDLYALRDDEAQISVNIGGIEGGAGKANIVAENASLMGEFRCFEPVQAERMKEEITAICQKNTDPLISVKVEFPGGRPPMPQSEASKVLFGLAKRCAEANGLTLQGKIHGGGSDGSYAASTGIPVLDGMGAEGEFSHTDREYARADTMMMRLKTCIDLMTVYMKEN
ncbi:MAG: M20 family metallopeptidase [Oscillospiraceae bacterium]|nr:M20 family metallopeptidase [Oscillospiraceae bacterium]